MAEPRVREGIGRGARRNSPGRAGAEFAGAVEFAGAEFAGAVRISRGGIRRGGEN